MHLVIASASTAYYPVGRKKFGNDMTDTNLPPAPRLWTPEGFQEDEWRRLAADEPVPAEGKVILPLDAFTALEPDVAATVKCSVPSL